MGRDRLRAESVQRGTPDDDGFIDRLAGQDVAYVPFFPLGSPNILLIPGTSSVAHLRENLQAARLRLAPEMVAKLDSIGGISA